MTTEEKIELITRNCEEVITKEDLRRLLNNGTELHHYIGFEISGLVHLGTGYISMGKVADFLRAGVKCQIFLADFHTYLNNKLGGNIESIRWAAVNYFKEALIASLKCHEVNVDQELKLGNLTFIPGFDLYKNNLVHWETFMEVGKHVTLSRDLRSISIMGKKQGNEVDMATLFYPPLQVADIYTMKVNLAHAGMDQRKAHVIARDVAHKLTINPLLDAQGEIIAPIAIHHNLIAGLNGPEKVDTNQGSEETATDLKMSKSKPSSAIFVHDSPDEIREKVRKAYGPPKEIKFNPLLNWVKVLIFWGEDKGSLMIERPEKFGGNITYTNYGKLEKDYAEGTLFPLDLKNALAEWLINRLEPARNYFAEEEHKKDLEKMVVLLNKK
ncbi:tyrosine--tRNA ligase [Patescibacteria group bacterium]|nr:tyrosine--tRNA ligase [Patescibacteria group bacterium]